MGLPNIGPLELIIILAIALLIVGPRRLPEMGSAFGRTIREFRKASTEIGDAASTSSGPDTKEAPTAPVSSEAAAPALPASTTAPASPAPAVAPVTPAPATPAEPTPAPATPAEPTPAPAAPAASTSEPATEGHDDPSGQA